MARGDKKYFRHSTSAYRDEKIQEAIRYAGKEIYFYFFTLLELCASDAEGDQTSFTYSLKFLETYWNTKPKKCRSSLEVLDKFRLCSVEVTDNLACLNIPNISKFIGKYVLNKGKETKEKETKENQRKGNKNVQKNESAKPSSAREPEVFHRIISLWNDTVTKLPHVKVCSPRRKKICDQLWKSYPSQEFWIDLFNRVNTSSFLCGAGGRNWAAGFDWVMNQNNLAKILEGNYDDSSSSMIGKNSLNGEALATALRNLELQKESADEGN